MNEQTQQTDVEVRQERVNELRNKLKELRANTNKTQEDRAEIIKTQMELSDAIQSLCTASK